MVNTQLKKGLSLLEIVIGISIIAMAFIPIMRVVQFGNKSTVKISNFSKVSRIAQKLIEECKHVPFPVYKNDYKDLGNESWFDINPDYYPKSKEAIVQFEQELKQLKWSAKLKLKKTSENIIREVWIQIFVTWEEGDGTTSNKPRELRLAQAIHNPDAS